MAKAPAGTGSPSFKTAAAESSGKAAPGGVARQAKASVKGNGNRSAQVELDLKADTPGLDAQAGEPKEPTAAARVAGGLPALVAAPPVIATPAMRELGLTRKEIWKVDLKGKRIALDEKGWREELGRALGRNAGKS